MIQENVFRCDGRTQRGCGKQKVDATLLEQTVSYTHASLSCTGHVRGASSRKDNTDVMADISETFALSFGAHSNGYRYWDALSLLTWSVMQRHDSHAMISRFYSKCNIAQ